MPLTRETLDNQIFFFYTQISTPTLRVLKIDTNYESIQIYELDKIYLFKKAYYPCRLIFKPNTGQRIICKVKTPSILEKIGNSIPVVELSAFPRSSYLAAVDKTRFIHADITNEYIYYSSGNFPDGVKIPYDISRIEHVFKDISTLGVRYFNELLLLDEKLFIITHSAILTVGNQGYRGDCRGDC